MKQSGWDFPVRKSKWDVSSKNVIPIAHVDHEWRLKGIGGSDAGVIMGVTPSSWGSIEDLWKIKTRRSLGKPQTYPMKRGLTLEPIARQAYQAQTGILMPAGRAIHERYDFIRANFDGRNEEERRILEIKAPGFADHQVARQGKIPQKYIWQCVHLLLVSGFDELDYYSFDGREGIIVHFTRDKLLEEVLFEAESAFWDCVVRDVPPGKKKELSMPTQKKNEIEVSSKELAEFLVRARELGVTSLTLNLNGQKQGYELHASEADSTEFCNQHQTEFTQGKYGPYCRDCYIERKERGRH